MTKAAKPIAVDLATLDTCAACNQPFALDVKHPVTKVATGIVIYHLGVDSDAITEYVDERNNKDIRRAADLRKRGEEPEVVTVEAQLERNIEFWTVAIFSSGKPWENMTFEGKALDFTVANIKLVLTRLKWLRGQVDASIGNLENFMPT
jgi:hypothetical protein